MEKDTEKCFLFLFYTCKSFSILEREGTTKSNYRKLKFGNKSVKIIWKFGGRLGKHSEVKVGLGKFFFFKVIFG